MSTGWWAVIWAFWLVTAAGSFWILEWLSSRDKATLSETLRRWLGVDPSRPWRRLAVALFTSVVTSFVAWFVPHIVG